MKKNVPGFLTLILLSFFLGVAAAQIPPTSGLPLKWQHLFAYPTGNSLYPEDAILNDAGNPCFLHNTGLLEGSLFTELNAASGAIVAERYNSVDALDFRFVGVALKNSPDGDQVTILGNRIISNSVQAIPPVGTFAIQEIIGQQVNTWAPSWQSGGVISRNDRGLPWIQQTANENYWIAEPYVGSDNLNVAWIRSINGASGALEDTVLVLSRPQRNGLPVGNSFDYSRIRGFEQLPNGQFLLLYAQQRNPDQPQYIVNELIWMDENGNLLNRLDISEATQYATLPNMLVAGNQVLVYGITASTQTTGLAILTTTGEMVWNSGANNSPVFRFSEITHGANGTWILVGTDPLLSNRVVLSSWQTGAVGTTPLGDIKFEDSAWRATCTKAFGMPNQDVVLMLQMDRFNGLPTPTAEPEEVYHIALAIPNTAFSVSTSEYDNFGRAPLRIAPNPNNGQFNIVGTDDDVIQIRILDMTGRVVWDALNAHFEKINLPRLATGAYQVFVQTNAGYTVQKMVVH